MGGLCSSSTDSIPTTTVVQQQNDLPAYVEEGGQKLFDRALTLSEEGYQPYDGPRVAGLSSPEQQAVGLSQSGVGTYQPYVDKANALVDLGGAQWNSETADQYMNPYSERVLDVTARKMNEQFDNDRNARNTYAVQSGAFGGDRQGVFEAERRKNVDQAVQDMYLQGTHAAYENAREAFGEDRGAALDAGRASSALGQLQAGLQATDISNLMGTGAALRGVEQQALDTGYRDFLDQKFWPYQQLNFASGVLRGVPYESSSTQSTAGQQITQAGSPISQAAGLGLAGAALGGLFWGGG